MRVIAEENRGVKAGEEVARLGHPTGIEAT